MHRRSIVLRGLVLALAPGLIFIFGVSPCPAQEQITITTYYPSPMGSYNELQSNKFAVGDTNSDSQLTAADLPPANGQLYAARSIIFKPQASDPAADRVTGELIYNSSENAFKYWDGSQWVAQAGAGGCYVSYSGGCLTGFTNRGSAGSWGSCEWLMRSGAAYFRPPGGGCDDGFTARVIGTASVCCQ